MNRVRLALDFPDRSVVNGIIANRIIEIANAGERNADLLYEGAPKKVREHLYGD